MINNHVVESNIFKRKLLEDESFERQYLEYLLEPTKTKEERLNETYKQYEIQLMAKKYLSKMIFFEAKKFDSKIRKIYGGQFSLDAEYDENLMFLDALKDKTAEYKLNKIFEKDLKECFCDEKLSKEISSLTTKQKEVLHGIYVLALTESMLAQQLGVSQQAVSKTHRTIIKRLRKAVFEC